jgi:1-phosphofructokinase family hexose kinase
MIYTLTLNPALDKQFLVNTIEFNQVLRTDIVQTDFGGKGFNVSRMLKALGSESVALGLIGGKTGETLTDGLAHLGIHTDFVRVSEETRTNISIVPQDHSQYIKVNEPGPVIQADEINNLVAKIAALAKNGDWWVLAGSLPRGIGADIYARLIHLIQSQGARVILDASGEPLLHGCRAAAYLAKPNAEEAEKLIGLRIETVEQAVLAARQVAALGVTHVVLSLGKLGALWHAPEGTWLVYSPEIEEHNPIGAGDSMVAGLVWGLAQGLPVADILRWGVACGAAAASLDGTAVGDQALVASLFAKTIAQQLT